MFPSGWSVRESNPELPGVSSRQSTPSKRPSVIPSRDIVEYLVPTARSIRPRACGQLRVETQPKASERNFTTIGAFVNRPKRGTIVAQKFGAHGKSGREYE